MRKYIVGTLTKIPVEQDEPTIINGEIEKYIIKQKPWLLTLKGASASVLIYLLILTLVFLLVYYSFPKMDYFEYAFMFTLYWLVFLAEG